MTLYINKLSFSALALILGLAFLLGGCGGGDSPVDSVLVPEQPQQPTLSRAEQLAANGNWLAAAQAWRQQAANENSPQRESSLLMAADMFLRAHAHDDARQLLSEIVIINASVELQTRLQLLKARLALAERRPNDALGELGILQNLPIDASVQPELLALRADIFSQTGHHFEAARQRIQLDALLDSEQQPGNQNRIWESLNMLGPLALDSLRLSSADDLTRGWLDLAWLAKGRDPQSPLSLALADWQRRYPQHPASSNILPTLQTLDAIPLTQPAHIALLLPLEGKFANAARAVRDGFLNAYYADAAHEQTLVRIYPADSNNINLVYEQAVKDGANMVVGPLDKDSLLALLTRKEFTVPLLALNDIPGAELPANVYSFALTPEDEARQAAEHIWLDGHSRGIVLYPAGRWGERINQAFTQRWQELGGELLEVSSYDANGRDFASPIRQLLNVDESRQRHRVLKNLLDETIEFEMRRRQDVDFIFLAAYPTQARQLRPQFDFFNAGDIPVYATSHIYTGQADSKADRDMNGITFGDMPWTLDSSADVEQLKQDALRNWGKDRIAYTRLFAFGADAWKLGPQLERLSRYRFARLPGNTGSLRIDEHNRVQRGLTWAAFRAGKPRLVPPPSLDSQVNPLPAESPAQPVTNNSPAG